MHPSSWKPRHVITIVAMLSAAAILGPVAVHAVSTQPVTIYDQNGSDAVGVDGNGALKVRIVPPFSLYGHETLTSASPAAILGGVNCWDNPDCPWDLYSVGVTALPAAKSASYVQFRLVRFDIGTDCTIPAVDAVEPGTIWDLPALWTPVKSQTEYRFTPNQAWGGESNGYCVVAYLISGGPVDAHSEREMMSI